jgi:hypothetical protein
MSDRTRREAACACGDLRVTMEGEPMLVSSCCCTRCQRRTGSFFGVTVYLSPETEERIVGALAADIESGAWDRKHGHLRERPEINCHSA